MIKLRITPLMIVILCLIFLFGGKAIARSYSTNFPLSENPISEGGNWINGKTTGVDWNNVITDWTKAYGTMDGSVNYVDDTAILTGSWGSDQTAQAIVYSAVTSNGGWEEVELRLRSSLSAHICTGYEVLFSANPSNGYVQIVKWLGPLGSWYLMDARSHPGVVSGDEVKATISGTNPVTITAYINGTQVLQVTETTADSYGGTAPYTTGSPGIGFYNYNGGIGNSLFGFSSFTATDELSSNCSYALSPVGVSVDASGGSGNIAVTTQSGCSWSASTGVSWITITSGASGSGSGTVAYTVAANTGTSRTSATTIAGQIFTFTQSGISPFNISASAGPGGSISPSGSVSVTNGGSQSFTITPKVGYIVDNVTVDGASKGAVTSYTFKNVTANHTIAATFKAKTYTISASAGSGGSISPSGSVSVTNGGSQSFTIIPNVSYVVYNVTVDRASKGAVTSYTFNNVTANHTIAATFKRRTWR